VDHGGFIVINVLVCTALVKAAQEKRVAKAPMAASSGKTSKKYARKVCWMEFVVHLIMGIAFSGTES